MCLKRSTDTVVTTATAAAVLKWDHSPRRIFGSFFFLFLSLFLAQYFIYVPSFSGACLPDYSCASESADQISAQSGSDFLASERARTYCETNSNGVMMTIKGLQV
jgi:hypothetical protein